MIIPLSGKKKDRGLELWKQAGDILGASENSQDNQRSNSSNKKINKKYQSLLKTSQFQIQKMKERRIVLILMC
ncbi:hypothetical protein F310043J5_28780 [Anaerostipes hominis (ex Lee et al. 2021)]